MGRRKRDKRRISPEAREAIYYPELLSDSVIDKHLAEQARKRNIEAVKGMSQIAGIPIHTNEGGPGVGLFQQREGNWTDDIHKPDPEVTRKQELAGLFGGLPVTESPMLPPGVSVVIPPGFNPYHMRVSEDEIVTMPEPRSFVEMGSVDQNATHMDVETGKVYVNPGALTQVVTTDTNTHINPSTRAANTIQSQITAMREMIVQQQAEITKLNEKIKRLERRTSGPVSRKRGVKPTE